MNNIKITVNRKEPSQQEILKRRDFNQILRKFNFSRSVLISPWFYGAIGFSGVLTFIFLSFG
jgi:hypothetical protein